MVVLEHQAARGFQHAAADDVVGVGHLLDRTGEENLRDLPETKGD